MTTTQTQRPRVYLWPDGRAGGRIDISRDVLAINIGKTIHGRNGSWQIRLNPSNGATFGHIQRLADRVRRDDLAAWPRAREVRANAVVSIGIDTEGSWLGLVDSVGPDVNQRGTATHTVTLSGSDMQKVLARDAIVKAQATVIDATKFAADIRAVTGPEHSLLYSLAGLWGPRARPTDGGNGANGVPSFVAASVEDVVRWLLQSAPSMTVPLLASLGGRGRPGEFINIDGTISTWLDGRIYGEAPATFQGMIWDFVRSILDEDFYEAWIDTTPRPRQAIPRVDLIIRPKPFDERGLQWLPTQEFLGIDWKSLRPRIPATEEATDHIIPPDEVYQYNLGHSDADVYAYVNVSSQHTLLGNPEGLARGLYYPAVDLYHLSTHGLRSYEGRLSLLGGDVRKQSQGRDTVASEVEFEIAEFRNRLLNWYRLNHYFQAGTLTVAGRDRYRPGDPVLLPWQRPMRGDRPGVRYYCIGTTHNYQVGQPYTTTFQLMRGHNQSVIEAAQRDIAAIASRYLPSNPELIAATLGEVGRPIDLSEL